MEKKAIPVYPKDLGFSYSFSSFSSYYALPMLSPSYLPFASINSLREKRTAFKR
jgi:hypothetical protein